MVGGCRYGTAHGKSYTVRLLLRQVHPPKADAFPPSGGTYKAMAGRVSHPDHVVAWIKAAYANGVPKKVIAQRMGLSFATVKLYVEEQRRAEVQPDPAFSAMFSAFMRAEI